MLTEVKHYNIGIYYVKDLITHMLTYRGMMLTKSPGKSKIFSLFKNYLLTNPQSVVYYKL